MTTAFDPDWTLAPGETLDAWREERGLDLESAAAACRLSVADFESVVAGRKEITSEIAQRLEAGTRIPSRLWLNLERRYRDDLRRGKIDRTSGRQPTARHEKPSGPVPISRAAQEGTIVPVLNEGGWWSVDGRECQITIEKRPHYCDRGRYIAKLFPRGRFALDIDEADGWPRYYFDWDRMLAEIEAWMQARGQMPDA